MNGSEFKERFLQSNDIRMVDSLKKFRFSFGILEYWIEILLSSRSIGSVVKGVTRGMVSVGKWYSFYSVTIIGVGMTGFSQPHFSTLALIFRVNFSCT